MKMERKNFFKIATMSVAALFAVTLASCSDDDDDKKSGIRCNPSSLSIEVGKTADVKLAGGTEAYTVKSTDEKTATATVNKSTVTVTGVKEGKATLTITDAKKLSVSLPVTVTAKTADVTLDKTAAEVGVGKTAEVNVQSGTSPYSVSVKDTKIATAGVKGTKVTIKGLKAGTTTVTVSDKNKKTADIAVTVK